MKADQVILTRQLPKTGQETEHQIGDDGAHQAGWWKGLKVADNRTRFIAKTFNGDDVVIDLATGLMWAADGNEGGCYNGSLGVWALAVGLPDALIFAGFNDWRLPNVTELLSIIDFGLYNPSIKEPPFSNTASLPYWSSTTVEGTILAAWFVSFVAGVIGMMTKPTSQSIRCVRGGL